MGATNWRRSVRWLVVLSGVSLLALGTLVAYQKYYSSRVHPTNNPQLQEELAGATLVEEDPPVTGDWPQWRGPRRDGMAHFPDLLTTWPGRGPARL